MKKIFKIAFCFLLSLGLFSCSNSSNNNPNDNEGNNNDINIIEANGNRKIIYEVSYIISGSKVEERMEEINNFIIEKNGYIEKANHYTNTDNDFRAYYVYKIPTNDLNDLLKVIDSYEETSNKSIETTDITSSYSQVEAKITTLEASLAAYQKLLTDENLTIQEIIAINDKIDEINSELVNLYNQKDNYDENTNYSTIKINYYEKLGEDNAFESYGKYLLKVGETLILFILYSLPFLLITGIIIFIIFYAKKKRKQLER